jgi:hypothetical protein
MKLADVQNEMLPAVKAVLAKGLDFHTAQRAFLLTLIGEALEQSAHVQEHAALKIGMSPKYMSRIITGKTTPAKGRSYKSRTWKEKHGDVTPSKLLAERTL